MGKKLLVALVCFAMFGALTGCAQEQPVETTAETECLQELEFIKTKLVGCSEPHGAEIGTKDGWRVMVGKISYSFMGIKPQKGWDEIVWETNSIVNALEARFGEIQGKRTMCIFLKPYAPRKTRDTLYIGKQNFQTLDYAVGIAQMIYGNEVNYGLLYALGAEIAVEQGYPVEETVSLDEALTLCDTEPAYLDLNYACFLKNHGDEVTIQKVKTIARELWITLTDAEKADLLNDYSDEKYCRYLNRFLAENGKPAYDNSDLNNTLFYNGGEEIRLVWENEDATFYVGADYRERAFSEIRLNEVLNSDYPNLRQMVVDYTVQVSWLKDKFQPYLTDQEKPDVLFLNGTAFESGAKGTFYSKNNEIFLDTHVAFAHEYVHYLTQYLLDSGQESRIWLGEMLAYYFSYFPGDAQLSYEWMNDKLILESLNADSELWESYTVLTKVQEQLGRPLDFNSSEDYYYNNDALAAAADLFGSVTNGRSSIYKISFANYLISRYGENEVIKAVCKDSPRDTLGSTWDDLREDWEKDIKTEFAWARGILAK